MLELSTDLELAFLFSSSCLNIFSVERTQSYLLRSAHFFNVRSRETAVGTTLWDEQLICVRSVIRGFAVIKSSGASTKAGSRVPMRRQIEEMSEQHEEGGTPECSGQGKLDPER